MTERSSMVGYAPTVEIGPAPRPAEQAIYEQMWARPEYRQVAPGEDCAQLFASIARPRPGSTLVDLGCGTGRGGLALAMFAGLDVTLVDFAANCLDADMAPILERQSHAIRFVQADLTKPIPVVCEYGYCTDVLEHIPPESVDAVIDNCLRAAQHVFFQIATEDDVCGALIGHPLHLSVHPFEWWERKFRERDCVVHWSGSTDGACMFYVSAWQTARDIVKIGTLNVEQEAARENVRVNIARGFEQARPYETTDVEVAIVGGGPSLAGQVEALRAMRERGVKVVALNGAHDWLLDHGITPSAQIVVDAREFNARFTRRPVAGCRYMLASQCHPSVFEGIPPEQVLLWHTSAEDFHELLDAQYGTAEQWWGIPGGSTVLLRAIPLLRMLGFARFHLFGCDSCLSDSQAHHAYAQPENDEPMVIPVTAGGRVFHCHAWMAAQAQEFQDLIRVMGSEFELEIYGDGLLRHTLVAAAEEQDRLDEASESAAQVGTAS